MACASRRARTVEPLVNHWMAEAASTLPPPSNTTQPTNIERSQQCGSRRLCFFSTAPATILFSEPRPQTWSRFREIERKGYSVRPAAAQWVTASLNLLPDDSAAWSCSVHERPLISLSFPEYFTLRLTSSLKSQSIGPAELPRPKQWFWETINACTVRLD